MVLLNSWSFYVLRSAISLSPILLTAMCDIFICRVYKKIKSRERTNIFGIVLFFERGMCDWECTKYLSVEQHPCFKKNIILNRFSAACQEDVNPLKVFANFCEIVSFSTVNFSWHTLFLRKYCKTSRSFYAEFLKVCIKVF